MRLLVLCLLAPLALACVTARERTVAGFQNPEDLAPLPGDAALLVSEYGAMEGGRAGRLALYELASDARRVLFRGGDAEGAPQAGWGDPACPGPPPPEFSPHGIDLVRRPDGALQLWVVQHGGRESIEVFEVTGQGAQWRVAWRGCVPAPEDAWLNEVVGLPDGGLLASHMMPLSGGIEQLATVPTEPTGLVYAWTPGAGWAPVPGTAGMMPNGVEVSPDGKTVFLNLSMESQVRVVDRATGQVRGSAAVPYPDNSTWTPDGSRLLVASLRAEDPDDFEVCQGPETRVCPLPFAIVALDPETLETTDLYVSDGAPMGGGTVGLRVGDELFVGTFSGDRLLRVQLR